VSGDSDPILLAVAHGEPSVGVSRSCLDCRSPISIDRTTAPSTSYELRAPVVEGPLMSRSARRDVPSRSRSLFGSLSTGFDHFEIFGHRLVQTGRGHGHRGGFT
jgi:hypothetical protein